LHRQPQGGDFLLFLSCFTHQLQGGVDGIDLGRCIHLQLSGQTVQGGRAFVLQQGDAVPRFFRGLETEAL